MVIPRSSGRMLAMYEQILLILGGSGILVTAVAWLIRSLVTHLLSKDVENFKEQLKAANALELERLRSELAIHALEHEVKFRRIDEKVAKHLNIIYQRLFKLYEAVGKFVSIIDFAGEPTKEEKLEIATQYNTEFWNYFLHNRVYVPPTLYKQIREFGELITKIANDFGRGLENEKRGLSAGESHWLSAYEDMKERATPMFTALVDEIQRRLGVVDPPTS